MGNGSPVRRAASAYGGDASNLPVHVFQDQLDAIAAGQLAIRVHKVYDGLEQVRQAHADMEANAAIGKLVVRVDHGVRSRTSRP